MSLDHQLDCLLITLQSNKLKFDIENYFNQIDFLKYKNVHLSRVMTIIDMLVKLRVPLL